jgi:hypothetical protein
MQNASTPSGEVGQSSDSAELLRKLSAYRGSDTTQLRRIFRKYVSPSTSVEMLKRKRKIDEVTRDFGPASAEVAHHSTLSPTQRHKSGLLLSCL